MRQVLVDALHSTLLSYMSDEVRPTPCSWWLADQPFVAVLSEMSNSILIDPDGTIVSRGTARTTEGCRREVRHLGVYTAVIIVSL